MLASQEEADLSTPSSHPVFILQHAVDVDHLSVTMATQGSFLSNNVTVEDLVTNSSDTAFFNLTLGQDPGGGGGGGTSGILLQEADMYHKPWPHLKQTLAMIVLLCVVYLLILVLGVVNNALVVSVIYRNMQMRTVTNYFIANLALADILVSILVIPTLLSSIFTGKIKYYSYHYLMITWQCHWTRQT